MLAASRRWLPPNRKQLFSRPFFILLCLMTSALFIGCKANIDYQSGAPPEKLCTLNIMSPLAIKSFDGQEVDWGSDDEWTNASVVRIPEGAHTFIVTSFSVGGLPGVDNIPVSYDKFVAGRTYHMIGTGPMGYPTGPAGFYGIVVEDVTGTNAPASSGK